MNDSSFDNDLRKALKRVEPPLGFAERVMASVPGKRPRSRYWFGAVAAGFAVLASFGGIEQYRHQHRAEAEQTHRQVLFALSLASEKVDQAMNRANSRLQRSAPDVTIGVEEKGRL